MCGALAYIRFTPKSDVECVHFECPLWANSEGQEDDECGVGSTLERARRSTE